MLPSTLLLRCPRLGPCTSFLTAERGLMQAPVQEVEGGLQDVHVIGAALPTQFAHCKR